MLRYKHTWLLFCIIRNKFINEVKRYENDRIEKPFKLEEGNLFKVYKQEESQRQKTMIS